MNDSWQNLRVGDRVRIVRLPSEWEQPGYRVFASTRRVYERLIERRRSVRVHRIDERGLPWIACRFRNQDGSWEHHFLAINDDSWVRVRHRRPLADKAK